MAKPEIKKTETTRDVSRGPQTDISHRGYDPFGAPLRALDALHLNPLSLMRRLTGEMDRVIGPSVWAPVVEVSENGGLLTVRAELPGLKPEDVKLEIDNSALTLEGERTETSEHKEAGLYRSERHYGRFYRSIPLPEGAEIEQANARFENGVLEVTIPAPPQKAQRRQIPIRGDSTTPAPEGGAKAA